MQSLKVHSDTSKTVRRLILTDTNSGDQYLVDTGDSVSVIPKSNISLIQCKPSDFKLNPANGSEIKTFGTKSLKLDFGFSKQLRWNFVIADISKPIFRIDFLENFGILVVVNRRRLIFNNREHYVNSVRSNQYNVSVTQKNKFYNVLLKYPEIITDGLVKKIDKHSTVQYIETKGPPIYATARRLSVEKYKMAENGFDGLIKAGL